MKAFCSILLFTIFIYMNEGARVPLKPVYERSNDNFSSDRSPFAADTPQEINRRAHIHARNQQQRFNLEKDRKQKAIMERNKTHGGQTMDSYVKAYQEQHEEHQRDIETRIKEQEKENEKIIKTTKNRSLKDYPNGQWWLNPRQIRSKRVNTDQDFIKMKENQNKNRVTRIVATGSNNMPYILSPNYVYVPIQTYGENLHEFTPMFDHSFLSPQTQNQQKTTKQATSQRFRTEGVNALTKAALSHSHSQHNFNQLSNYKGIDSLNALIGKKPTEQLRGFNELLKSTGNNHKLTYEDLTNSHINIDASSLDIKNNKRPNSYINISPDSETQDNHQYTYSYKDYPQLFAPEKDHTPITENVQDIADTEKPLYTIKYVYSTENPVTSSSYYTVKDDNKVVVEDGPKSGVKYSYTPEPDNMHYASEYEFGYRVSDHHSGNDFGHQETSDGESRKGSYHVLLPDGRIQKVSYVAGPSGFHADISYQ